MSKLFIATVSTQNKYYFDYLKNSCKKNGKDLTVLGYGEKWKGFNWRFKVILEFAKTLNPDDIICVVDGYDVISVRNLEYLPVVFKELQKQINCKIIVAYDNINHANLLNKILIYFKFGRCNGYQLNAGTYIGYVKDIIDVITNLLYLNSDDASDDQVLLTKYCDSNTKDVYIDVDNKLFLTLATPLQEASKFLEFKNGSVFYNNHEPFFIHGPGKTFLNDIIIKLNYDSPNDTLKNIKNDLNNNTNLFIKIFFKYPIIYYLLFIILISFLIFLFIRK